jgi:CheY-like chemotaxis protein
MKRILVVDDDRDLRSVLRLVLEKDGYEVSEAGTGAVALGILQSRPVDLMITDIFMPEIGGLGMMQSLPPRLKGMPVIAMSGGADRTAREPLERAEALGAVRTFAKPFAVAEVLAAVREFAGPGSPTA